MKYQVPQAAHQCAEHNYLIDIKIPWPEEDIEPYGSNSPNRRAADGIMDRWVRHNLKGADPELVILSIIAGRAGSKKGELQPVIMVRLVHKDRMREAAERTGLDPSVAVRAHDVKAFWAESEEKAI